MEMSKYETYLASKLLDEDKEELIKYILYLQKEYSRVLHDYFSLQATYDELQEKLQRYVRY